MNYFYLALAIAFGIYLGNMRYEHRNDKNAWEQQKELADQWRKEHIEKNK